MFSAVLTCAGLSALSLCAPALAAPADGANPCSSEHSEPLNLDLTELNGAWMLMKQSPSDYDCVDLNVEFPGDSSMFFEPLDQVKADGTSSDSAIRLQMKDVGLGHFIQTEGPIEFEVSVVATDDEHTYAVTNFCKNGKLDGTQLYVRRGVDVDALKIDETISARLTLECKRE